MQGVNKAILMGYLGQDPDVHQTKDGKTVTNVNLATSMRWTDKKTGELQESTEWHRVVFFNRLAEIAAEYLTKGKPIYIEGRNRTRKWTDDNGIDRWATEIIAHEMQMLPDGKDNGGNATGKRPPQPPAAEKDPFDDDIPF